MNSTDIRWRQRLQNCQRALERLRAYVKLAGKRSSSELEQGLFRPFEFTHELPWKVDSSVRQQIDNHRSCWSECLSLAVKAR